MQIKYSSTYGTAYSVQHVVPQFQTNELICLNLTVSICGK